MAATPESGFLLIADLTGYTAYVAGGEIEHAPVIAGDLLETIVGRLEPPFRLDKFEGDAAFLHVEDGRAEGSLLLDAIDASYLAFRRRLRSIEQATTCECNSCRRAPRLDLKYFVHHGLFIRGRIAGRDELAGSAVIVVHRLLKGGTATAAHGPDGRAAGFAVYTAEAVRALGIDPLALELAQATETIEHLGAVDTFTQDLETRWQSETGQQRLTLDSGEPLFDIEIAVPAEPATVWPYLTSPALRPTWEGPIRIAEQAPDGRRGVGTTSQCVTGALATLEEIVDWQPFDHAGYRLAVADVGPIVATFDLAPLPSGTQVRLRWQGLGNTVPEAATVAAIELEKRSGLGRLAAMLAPQRPVQEVTHDPLLVPGDHRQATP